MVAKALETKFSSIYGSSYKSKIKKLDQGIYKKENISVNVTLSS